MGEYKGQMKSAVVGMVLGDGNLQIAKRGKNAYLQLHHSLEQADYLLWKADILRNGKFPVKVGRSDTAIWARTKCVPFMTDLQGLFYPRGKKEVTEKLLSHLTPMGLAIWYMDDGSIREKKEENGAIRGRDIRLYTCSFGDAEHDLIIKYFKSRWNVEWHKRPIRQRGKEYKYLGCGSNEAAKLFKIIEPFVIPSMRYKITFSLNKLRPNVWHPQWVMRQSELHGDVKSAAEMTVPTANL